VVPDIDAHCQAQERTFVRQVGPVASVLASLDMVPFRLRFSGTAGSGKSLVARHFFARLAAEGKRVLLTCFNRPLAMRIRGRVPVSGYVDTFHGFCVEFLKHCGQAPRFDRAGGDPDFWRRIPDLVAAERIPDAWRFDALVVDEGQDFEQDWFDVLTLFLREDADILWLEDADQNLQGKPPVNTVGFVAYRCTFNYRSPESIARVIRNTLPFEFDLGNDLPGLGVGVHGYDDAPAHRAGGATSGGTGMSDIRVQKAGEPDVLQTSDGRLTLSVPIQIKRRSGRKLVTLPNGETAPVRPWDLAPT